MKKRILATLILTSFAASDEITDISNSVSDATELYSVWYDAGNQTGYVGSINAIYKVAPNGWTRIDLSSLYPGSIKKILMTDSNTGFILGSSGVFYTTDGFNTINRATMNVASLTENISPSSLGFSDMDRLPPCAYVITRDATAYLSWDGGYSYLPLSVPSLSDYVINGIGAIGCTSRTESPAEGITYTIYTFDFVVAGGKILNFGGYEGVIASVKCTVNTLYLNGSCEVWNFKTFTGDYFYGLHRFGGEYYAVGEDGGIYRSTDTISWQKMGVNMYNSLFAAFMRDDSKLYFGGENILQTYVDGTLVDNVSLIDNYTTTSRGAVYDIYVSFDPNTNSYEGFAVGIKDTLQPLILKLREILSSTEQ